MIPTGHFKVLKIESSPASDINICLLGRYK